MPSIEYSFSIELQEEPDPPYATLVCIRDPTVFFAIEALGFPVDVEREKWGRRVKIQCKEGDPRLESVLSKLASLGYKPSPFENYSNRENKFEFLLGACRTYSGEEITEAPLLSLGIPEPYPQIANWDMSASRKGQLTIKTDSFQRSDLDIGMVDCMETYLVTRAMMTAMVDDGLSGVNFREVAYDRPDEVTKRLWQMVPGQLMPSSRTRLIDGWTGGDIIPGKTESIAWQSDAYPREIAFSRDEVESIQPFDIAFTREAVGNFPDRYRPDIIVSQRFRKFFEERDIRWIPYVLVRLE